MLLLIYNLFWHLLLPFLLLRLLWKSRKNPAYRKRLLERFAIYNEPRLELPELSISPIATNEHCERKRNNVEGQNTVTNIDSSSLAFQRDALDVSKRSLFNINEHCERKRNNVEGQNTVTNIDSSSLTFQRDALDVSKRSLFNINEHCERKRNNVEGQNTKSLWVHAVSLGEVTATTPLIKALSQQYPDYRIIFTTMTPTGMAQMQKTFGLAKQNPTNSIILKYVPYDYPWAIKKFLTHFNPKFLIIMETELWPNILHYCHKQKRPIFLINARLTEKSFASYYKIRRFTQKMLTNITLVMAQSQKDANYFLKLGLPTEKLSISGNIKFAITIAKETITQGKQLRQQLGDNRLVWIAASTHQGEEEIILDAYKKILPQIPNALLILVPRHPERFDEVALLCQKQNFSVARYSRNEKCSATTNILLGDVMGKLLLFYAAADIALVGGSLVPIGGHNILEAAALKLPIIVGAYTNNLADIAIAFKQADALITIKNSEQLAETVINLLNDPALRQHYTDAASKILEKNQNIIDEILHKIQTTKIGTTTNQQAQELI